MQRDIIKLQHLRPPSAALIFDDGEILWGDGLDLSNQLLLNYASIHLSPAIKKL